MRRYSMYASVLAIGAAWIGLAACGGEDGGTTTVITEKTVTQTTPTTEDGAGGGGGSGASSGDTGGGGGGGSDITVPDLVGKDHQLAQDTLQAAGLYSIDEQDATGQDRLLLWDRNWTVVRQDPPAGTRVSENDTVTLYSKKDGE